MKMTKMKLLAMLLTASMVVTPMASAAPVYAETAVEGEEPAQNTTLEDGTYQISMISSLNMFHFDDVKAVVDGDMAQVTIHGITTKGRYDQIFLGTYAELQAAATSELPESGNYAGDATGAVIGVADPGNAEDGTSNAYYFTFDIPTSQLTEGSTINYVTRYTAGYSSTHDGDWYQAKGGDYYFTINAIQLYDGVRTLAITNTTAMFKAVSASFEMTNGAASLRVALSGTGCEVLYPGVYEEAEATASGDTLVDDSQWITYTENAAGKYEFVIPLEDGQTNIPVTSLSASSAKSGTYKWFARQFVIDYDAMTLTCGDYEGVSELALTNKASDFSAGAVMLNTLGGPTSNNYKETLMLVMDDSTYTQAYVGTAREAGAAETTIALDTASGNVFSIPVKENAKGGIVLYDYLDQDTYMSFYKADTSTWVTVTVNVSKTNNEVKISPVADTTDVRNELKGSIGSAEELIADEGVFTEESMKALKEAVAAAEEVAADPTAVVEELQKAESAVEAALENMQTIVDQKTESLIAAVKVAEAITNDDGTYTAESYKALTDAIAAAKETIAKEEVTAEELTAAQAAVEAAEAGLKTVAAQKQEQLLNTAVEAAKKITNNAGTYTAASYKTLTDAIAAAEAAAAKQGVTAEELAKAQAKVEAAKKALVEIVTANTTTTQTKVTKPAKTSLVSVKNVKGKKIVVKWKKNTKVNGYQVQYSTSKTFKSGNKTKNVTKKTKTSLTLTKLKKGKTYYVRIRGYKTASGKKVYSNWSKAKKVKITK